MASLATAPRQFAFISSDETSKRRQKAVRRHLNAQMKRSKTRASTHFTVEYTLDAQKSTLQTLDVVNATRAPLTVSDSTPSLSGDTPLSIPKQISGATTFDPFLTHPQVLPSDATSQLLPLSAITCFESIRPAPPRSNSSTEAEAWLSAAISSPTLFSAILFGASFHFNELYGPDVPQSRLRDTLSLKVAVIKNLTTDLCAQAARIDDSTLAAVWILGGHNALVDPVVGEDGELISPVCGNASFRLPLPRILTMLQRLDLLSESPFLAQHVEALVTVVSARGGLETLKLPALVELVSAADVVLSTLSHSPPRLPLPDFSPKIIGYCNLKPIFNHKNSKLDHEPEHNMLPLPLQILISDMSLYTSCLDHYAQARIIYPDLSALADWRNRIQHDLLSFPCGGVNISGSIDASMSLASLVYNALLMYSHYVIFPVSESKSARLLSTYLNSYMTALQCLRSGRKALPLPFASHDYLLWSLTLATMTASIFEYEREHDVLLKPLTEVCAVMQIDTFEMLMKSLKSLLWLSHALDTTAMELWNAIQTSRHNGGKTE